LSPRSLPRTLITRAAASFFNSFVGELLVTPYVVNEVCYLTERDMGSKAEAAFLRSLARGGLRQIEIEPDDLFRMAELVETYADFPLGMADASVIAVAERLAVCDIATLDHRHFRVVRPRHTTAFRLLPD
jgi:uncharacterized protein